MLKSDFIRGAVEQMREHLAMPGWSVREKIVLSAHILHAQGHGSGLAGQISSRLDDSSHFFTQRMGQAFDEIRNADLLLVDEGLRVLDGRGMPNPANRFHAWIYRDHQASRYLVKHFGLPVLNELANATTDSFCPSHPASATIPYDTLQQAARATLHHDYHSDSTAMIAAAASSPSLARAPNYESADGIAYWGLTARASLSMAVSAGGELYYPYSPFAYLCFVYDWVST